MQDSTRRSVVLGAGGVGLAVALSACGGYSAGTDTVGTGGDDRGSGGTGGGGGAEAADGAAPGTLGTTDAIDVGGGKIFKDAGVVVTQPSAGEFKAFSATCTHMGCTVGTVSGGTINCPCHGSKFKIDDGSVARGPASRPLETKAIAIKDGRISLA
jgi:Rieske Fe-S protein